MVSVSLREFSLRLELISIFLNDSGDRAERMLIASAEHRLDKSGSTLCRTELEFRIILANQGSNVGGKKKKAKRKSYDKKMCICMFRWKQFCTNSSLGRSSSLAVINRTKADKLNVSQHRCVVMKKRNIKLVSTKWHIDWHGI